MNLDIIKFIQEHKDWEQILSEKPYSLTISRKEMFGRNLMMLKYSQIDSDFSIQLVRECRGLILDEDTLEVVSFPFMKFGNYGESYSDQIDWNSAKILEKIDGSLIKVVRLGNDFLISTNGTIDADDAPIPEQIGCNFKSFGDAVRFCLNDHAMDQIFGEGMTYMFELVSPYTRVVIPYPETKLYFLGARDNRTYQEYLPQNHILSLSFSVPKAYSFNSLDDCIKAAKELPWDEEGYVVVDKNFHRVKVKSQEWIRVHHIADNGNLSYEKAMEIIKANEIEEVVVYYPNLKDILLDLKHKYQELMAKEYLVFQEFDKEFSGRISSRKEKALWILSHSKIPALFFQLIDRKISTFHEWFEKCPGQKLVELLGLK